MEAAYYILMLLLVIGIPALAVYLIVLTRKPSLFNKHTKNDWSRGKIFGTGVAVLFGGILFLSIGINATMPQSIRDEIEASNAVNSQAQTSNGEKAEVKTSSEPQTPQVKLETAVIPITFASIEKLDSTLPVGQRKITTVGVVGERTETYLVTYIDNKETSKQLKKSEVSKLPVDEVVSVGTYVAPSAPVQNNSSSNAQPSQQQTAPSSSNTYYANCTAARAAGVTPIYRGVAGYRSALDRDNDGIACE